MSKKRRRSAKSDHERERIATLAQLKALLNSIPDNAVDANQTRVASSREDFEKQRQEIERYQAAHGLSGEVVVDKVPILVELPDGTRAIEWRDVLFFRVR